MTKERKIQNAALYWHTCKKDGFPQGQEKVFQEWLDKDIAHSHAYETLHSSVPQTRKTEYQIKQTRTYFDKKYFLFVVLIFVVIFLFYIWIKQ